jgi:programmed cell death protein 4
MLLNMKHGMVRLDNVWGVGGSIKPVKYLVSSGVTYLTVSTSVQDPYSFYTDPDLSF